MTSLPVVDLPIEANVCCHNRSANESSQPSSANKSVMPVSSSSTQDIRTMANTLTSVSPSTVVITSSSSHSIRNHTSQSFQPESTTKGIAPLQTNKSSSKYTLNAKVKHNKNGKLLKSVQSALQGQKSMALEETDGKANLEEQETGQRQTKLLSNNTSNLLVDLSGGSTGHTQALSSSKHSATQTLANKASDIAEKIASSEARSLESESSHSAGQSAGLWRDDMEHEGWGRQLINQHGLCEANEDLPQGPYLLILVQSHFSHGIQRNAIRDTWGRVRYDYNSVHHVMVVFVLGAPNDTDTRSWDSVNKEAKLYRDILLWNIEDGHHNHTVKSILALLWSFEYCPQAKYVLKTVDDIYLNVSAIVEYLGTLWSSKYTVTGHVELSTVDGHALPHCSGAAYAVGMDYVRSINRFLYTSVASYINDTLPDEDIYITWTLASTLGRQCRHDARFPTHKTLLSPDDLCKLLTGDLFGVHGVSFSMMYIVWKASHEYWDCAERPQALQDWLSQEYQYLNMYDEVEEGFTGG